MKTAAAIGVFLSMLAVAVLVFVYSGVYDVSATNPHLDVTYRLIRTVVEQSVKRSARDVEVPELDDPEKVHNGFKNFHEMCVICHGAPGRRASQISRGLYPQPADLAQAADAWTPAELYVITKYGIKMSGMPAWGPTHRDEELWELVAFLRVLPTMPESEYQGAVKHYEMKGAGSGREMQAGHQH